MDSNHSKIYYCSVSRGERMPYVYSSGDQEIENIADLCLKSAPPYHKWYFETLGKNTFGFLMKEGHIYFAIADKVIGNQALLQFLEQLRDEFKKVAKKGSRGSFSSMNSISLHEQLLPAIRNLITSLENVSRSSKGWMAETPSSSNGLSPSPSNVNGQVDVLVSTKAPLLGKPSKPDKKKGKDHVITMRGIEMEEHRKSTDRGLKIDLGSLESSNQGGSGSSIPVQKDINPLRRSNSQSIRKRWWRYVRIALAVDAALERWQWGRLARERYYQWIKDLTYGFLQLIVSCFCCHICFGLEALLSPHFRERIMFCDNLDGEKQQKNLERCVEQSCDDV